MRLEARSRSSRQRRHGRSARSSSNTITGANKIDRARHPIPRRRGKTAWRPRSTSPREAEDGDRQGQQHPDPVRPRRCRAGPRRRSPHCSPPAAVHQHLISRACAPRRASSSRPAAREGAPLRAARRLRRRSGHPYLAFETLARSCQGSPGDPERMPRSETTSSRPICRASQGHVQDGHRPTMSTAARRFRGRRPAKAFVDKYFTGTASNVEGHRRPRSPRSGAQRTARRSATTGAARHARRRRRIPTHPRRGAHVDAGRDRELQHATRANKFATYKEYAQAHQRAEPRSPRCAACSSSRSERADALTRSSPRRKSSSASPPAR